MSGRAYFLAPLAAVIVLSGVGVRYVKAVDEGTAWEEAAKLLPSDGAAGDAFGGFRSVSVSGDTALVGAGFDDDNGTDSGSAYVFLPAEIFADGFESGDTSAWDQTVP